MNGCARLRSHIVTSVSARPSVVTSVVATARSATAARTAASAKRRTSSASAGGSSRGALIAVGRQQRLPRRDGRATGSSSRTSMRRRPGISGDVTSIVPSPSTATSPVSRCAAGIVGRPVSSLNEPPGCAARSRLIEELVPPRAPDPRRTARRRPACVSVRSSDAPLTLDQLVAGRESPRRSAPAPPARP